MDGAAGEAGGTKCSLGSQEKPVPEGTALSTGSWWGEHSLCPARDGQAGVRGRDVGAIWGCGDEVVALCGRGWCYNLCV